MMQVTLLFRVSSAAVLFGSLAFAQTGFPFQDESLHYSVQWPSGLSLGEASLTARHSTDGWKFDFTMNAGIPGFDVKDHVRSSANQDLCSVELNRNTSHGSRKSEEKTTFDYSKGTATRVTLNGGGTTEMPISGCARDALDFLYFGRRELGQGRVPPGQNVFFGSSYAVRMEYTGAQTIKVNDQPEQTDRLVVYLKGPSSNVSFEVFYARDPARTPLLIRLPLAMGTFSMELVR
ncbi:MAG TPA: DUF3108 domain-containing protein [Bryobacteraceae bacterium]|nr:DUF3108 domain-containing protein [Bryobacteraceae bacterium]